MGVKERVSPGLGIMAIARLGWWEEGKKSVASFVVARNSSKFQQTLDHFHVSRILYG